ncbi:hypothetical protein Bca52824_042950 [Brassica carinata]|uniref:Uncharacterized protein n=1 Tax=Brassica carinata TaxID=52824 RepID=A0A8X7V083_BRACI|nr:hypothetical protein Bca52824_042950 [Brassica carinata]
MGMDWRVVPAEEWWEERGRDSSLDGERDLGLMVTDFLETGGGGSGGGRRDSWCSSDSNAGQSHCLFGRYCVSSRRPTT